MYQLWMQARAGIRKAKSASATLCLLFFVAALLLNAGLLVMINYGRFFSDLTAELNPASAYFLISDTKYTDAVGRHITEHTHVTESQFLHGLWAMASFPGKKDESGAIFMFQNMDDERSISKWKHIDDPLPAGAMTVYVPDILKVTDGYAQGDGLPLTFTDKRTGEKKTLTFTIGGFVEDILFSSYDTGVLSAYLPPLAYNAVAELLEGQDAGVHMVHTKLDDEKNAAVIESEVREMVGLQSVNLMALDLTDTLLSFPLNLITMSRCMMIQMVAAMMVVFSMVVVIVCLLVVRFRIVNSIQDDMLKIGSLKAIGYTGRQIRLALLMQFALLAGVGSLLGIAASYPIMPYISQIFEQQSGLRWVQGFDGAISALSLVLILGVVTAVSLLAARKVNQLTPVKALRGEGSERTFSRSRLWLDRTRGPLPVVLAGKSILQNLRQNLMIFIILVGVGFCGAFGIIMYYNSSVDTSTFAEVPGMEITNVVATFQSQKIPEGVRDEIAGMAGVRKAQFLDEMKATLNREKIILGIMDDFADKESCAPYEGHHPNAANQLSLSGYLARHMGVAVGDIVTLEVEGVKGEFVLCGLVNGMSAASANVFIRTADYRQLKPDFVQTTLLIYLDENTGTAAFIDGMREQYDRETLPALTNFDEGLEAGMASYQGIVEMMGLAMLIVTVFVVTLVLYFMISSSVIRRKRELGIQKALGYTTVQLMHQMALTFALPVALGLLGGSLLGAFGTNPLLSLVMGAAGLMKANFVINTRWVTAFTMGTLLFSYALSLFVTWRIRKITAYSLVTE